MSLMNELKTEITRLARKEIKKELEPIKRVNAAQRGLIANLRRDFSDSQKEIVKLRNALGKTTPTKEDSPEFWISGKRIVSLRKRLNITQAEMARLAKVTQQTVIKWEKTQGKITLRSEETAGLLKQLRGMGKKEARATLEKVK